MSMSNNTGGSAAGGNVQAIIKRFWGFDELIGSSLIKFIYYVGLVLIGLATLVALFRALGMLGDDAGIGLLMLIGAVLGGAIMVIFWRFICEIYILAYLFYARMGEIRDRLPPR